MLKHLTADAVFNEWRLISKTETSSLGLRNRFDPDYLLSELRVRENDGSRGVFLRRTTQIADEIVYFPGQNARLPGQTARDIQN